MWKGFEHGAVFGVVLALFAFILARPSQFDIVLPQRSDGEALLSEEGTVRSERSANISHIIGISRKIQLIVNKVMFLQIAADGAVNGTDNDNDYTILQRASFNHNQIKIQGVATCNFLCMDRCGLLYGSKEFTEECIFHETMESHHYNTYSSAKYSNDRRTLYLALNKRGLPRKVQTKARAPLGKLHPYTNVLTKPVPAERVESLAFARLLPPGGDLPDHHPPRHHRHQFCPNVPIAKLDDNNKFRCRKRDKRKKRRRCREDDDEDDDCPPPRRRPPDRCDDDEDDDDCHKRLHSVRQKRKSRNGDADPKGEKDKKRKRRLKTDKNKFSEKTLKSKCDGEAACPPKRPGPKPHRKDRPPTPPSTDPLPPLPPTDKPPSDYDDDDDDSTETPDDWPSAAPRD